MRDVEALETVYNGTAYRSRTEARWAVFLSRLGVEFEYEKRSFKLSTGEMYLPDFYIHDFDCYLEVKPNSEGIVTEECRKARALSNENGDLVVWLAMGAPSKSRPNIIVLSDYAHEIDMEVILADQENYFWILEDRRDERVYWLQSEQESGVFRKTGVIGGPGISTDHERLPMLHWNVLEAYEAAIAEKFD